MAVVALLVGSFLGLFGAISGYVFWDMSLLSAFGVYMGTSVGLAMLMIAVSVFNDHDGGESTPVSGRLLAHG